MKVIKRNRLFVLSFLLCLVSNMLASLPIMAQSTQKTQFGTNIGTSNYYSSDALYVDVMMHAQGWWSNTNPPVDLQITSEGYPSVGTGTSIIIMDGFPTGDYKFYGEGDFSFYPAGASILSGSLQKKDNITTALVHIDVPKPNTGDYRGSTSSKVILFFVTANDPSNPPNNFHLIRPDYPAWPNTNAQFGKEYLKALAPFQCIRVDTWTGPNWSKLSDWSSRPNPNFFGDGNQNDAYERAIDLANQSKCDLWVNFPLYATDDYIKNMANLLAQRLNPNLHVYYEVSNELWNWGFPEWQQVDTWAWSNPALTATGAWDRHGQEVAYLLMHHVSIVQPILKSMGRPILAGQFGGAAYTVGAGLDWINKTIGPPSNYIFGIAGAPYFVPSSADPSPTSLDALFQSMSDQIDGELAVEAKQYAALAQQYNVKFCCYESGQGLGSLAPASFPLYQSAQYDPRMATLYQKLASVLQANGCYLCNFFGFTLGHDSAWGFWSALPDIAYFNLGGTVKYNVEAALAAAGGQIDAKNNVPPPGSKPPGGSSPGPPVRRGKAYSRKPAKWIISPGMSRKMAEPPISRKH